MDQTQNRNSLWRRRGERILSAGLVLFLFVWQACDESLPPRIEPPTVLKDTLILTGLRPLIEIREGLPSANVGDFNAKVKNIYNEVLSDSARIRLNLEAWLIEYPEIRATITADERDLENSYLLYLGDLTLGIDTSASIYKIWNHISDEGTPFWSVPPSRPGLTNNGESYCQTDTVTLAVRGSVQVFERVQALPIEEMRFKVVYRIFGGPCKPGPS